MTYRTRDLGYYIIGREEEESKVQRIRDERETRDIRSREALRKSSMKKAISTTASAIPIV